MDIAKDLAPGSARVAIPLKISQRFIKYGLLMVCRTDSFEEIRFLKFTEPLEHLGTFLGLQVREFSQYLCCSHS